MTGARFRQALRNRHAQYGLWVTLESASITEVAIDLGFDWICVDMEHGHLGYREVLEHARAARGSETAVLVRVPDVTKENVQRVLDLGVDGVLLPLVRSAADVQYGFRHARYPPAGTRGIGGERSVRWGLRFREYLESANDEVLVIPIIETREAAQAIEGILDVPGLRAIFFGPADLSASFGFLGAWEGPGVADRVLSIKDRAAGRGVASGVMGTSVEDARARRDQGFALIGLGSDVGLMIRQARGALEQLRGGKSL
jgi:2-keto-3-deoxy-L-rhamnonate aldolase RhmA